ncbi:MAG: ABC transporter permease [Chitinophagales bacterium]
MPIPAGPAPVPSSRTRTAVRGPKDLPVTCALVVIWLLLGLFVFFPLARIFALTLWPQGAFDLAIYRRILIESDFRRTLGNSLLLGVSVASVSTLLGFVFAFVVHRTDVPLRRFFSFMATVSLVSPPFMLALAVILLLGRNGVITRGVLHLNPFTFSIYGLPGLILVQTLNLFPVAYLNLAGVLQRLNPELEDASLNLGGSRWLTFTRVTLPLALPGIAGAALLVFVESLADFGNPIVLGGRFDVLSVQAYQQFTGMFNMPMGAGLAVFLLIPTVLGFLLQKYVVGRRSYVTVTGKPPAPRQNKLPLVAKAPLFLVCFAVSVSILAIYLTVVAGSFFKVWGYDYTLTLEHFRYSWDVGQKALRDTLFLAGVSAPISGILGMLIAFLVVRRRFWGRRALEFSSMLSFAVPGTVVGIGYILAFNQAPLILTGTASILIACFVFRNLPMGVQSGIAVLGQIDPAIEEASVNLGAGSAETFRRVTLPLIRPALFAGMSYSFVRAMTAISAIIFLISAKWSHLTALVLSEVEILRLGPASVLSLVLMVVIIGAMGLIRALLGKDAVVLTNG